VKAKQENRVYNHHISTILPEGKLYYRERNIEELILLPFSHVQALLWGCQLIILFQQEKKPFLKGMHTVLNMQGTAQEIF